MSEDKDPGMEFMLLQMGAIRPDLEDIRREQDPNRTNPSPRTLSKLDFILSQRNSNPGQRYHFPAGMTTDQDREYAQGILNNIQGTEPFESEFRGYKSKNGYQ